MNVAVIFDSYDGHTERMAQAVAEGALSAGAEVMCKPAQEVAAEDLTWADGIALGAPTHMGTAGWKMKKFIDEVFSGLWMENVLIGKAGAVFNTGGSGGAGGAEITLIGMLSNLAANGMILVTHPRTANGYRPDGLSWGPSCVTGHGDAGPTEKHLAAARAHGERLAEVAEKLIYSKGGKENAAITAA